MHEDRSIGTPGGGSVGTPHQDACALVAASLIVVALGAASAAAKQARTSSQAQSSAVPERTNSDRTGRHDRRSRSLESSRRGQSRRSSARRRRGTPAADEPECEAAKQARARRRVSATSGRQKADVGTRVFVVDDRNPRKPKEVGFIDAMDASYPGEGNRSCVHRDGRQRGARRRRRPRQSSAPSKTKSSRRPPPRPRAQSRARLQCERAAVGRPLGGLLLAGQAFVSRRCRCRPCGRRARTPASAGSSGRA